MATIEKDSVNNYRQQILGFRWTLEFRWMRNQDDSAKLRESCEQVLDLDITGLTETHLVGNIYVTKKCQVKVSFFCVVVVVFVKQML